MPAILLDDRQGFTRYFDPHRVIVPFEVFAAERTVRFSISYLPRPVSLSELVPMANQLSQVIVDTICRRIEEGDGRITCRKGCDACCSYLVPISPAEAYHIRDELYKLPAADQRTLFRSCQHSARQLIEHKLPGNVFSPRQDQEDRLTLLSDWYKALKLPCPFLVHHSCCIYEFRPLACREYLVTSHPSKCRPESRERSRQVLMSLRIAEVLAETCRILEECESSVLLPLLPAFLQNNVQRSWTLFPAETVVSTFLEVLAGTTQRNLAMVGNDPTG